MSNGASGVPSAQCVVDNVDDRIAKLEHELEIARLRAEVAISLAPHIFAYLDHEPEPTGIVVDDVVHHWCHRTPTDAQTLTGPDSFIDAYIGQVEWARDADGEETYRAEFCLPGDQTTNEDKYFERVWEAQVERLRRSR